jgi:hypothetical protein
MGKDEFQPREEDKRHLKEAKRLFVTGLGIHGGFGTTKWSQIDESVKKTVLKEMENSVLTYSPEKLAKLLLG